MYARRTDKNQQIIVDSLRNFGAVVHDLSKNGKGIPDLLVGYRGETILVEVKSSAKAKYTKDQEVFNANWKGGLVLRINNLDELIEIFKQLNKKIVEK